MLYSSTLRRLVLGIVHLVSEAAYLRDIGDEIRVDTRMPH